VLRYVAIRLLGAVPVLFVVSVAAFLLIAIIPGDPTVAVVGQDASPTLVARAREQLHLDDPLPVQYARWMGGVLHGDFGRSFQRSLPVRELVGQALVPTSELVVFGLLYSVTLGVVLGLFTAVRRGRIESAILGNLSYLGLAVPEFVLGVGLIYIFALKLRELPAAGYVPFIDDPGHNLKLFILPTIALGSGFAAVVMRQTRVAILAVRQHDYIRTARAKGLTERAILWRHTLRTALIPIVTLTGLAVGRLIGGAVVVEIVFAIPGMGRLLVNAVLVRDLPLAQGIILVIAAGVVLSSILTDVLYQVLDPTIRVR
jgi:peptide/nickel transport system permease protein